MILHELLSAVEEFAPLSLQEEWDNSGLVYGDPSAAVRGALLGFDCTPQLIREAVEVGADVVITHHPLIFKGIKKIRGGDPVCDALVEAVRHGVAVYAAHTNADKVLAGVSGAMGRKLGLEDMDFLSASPGGGGLGVVGNLPVAVSGEEFSRMLKEAFGCGCVRTSSPEGITVSRVAMCGGSGSDFIADAVAAGAQAYVTADLHYHDFYVREGFMVADIGHYESEEQIVSILFSVIKKKFPNFATYIAKTKRNPVYYL